MAMRQFVSLAYLTLEDSTSKENSQTLNLSGKTPQFYIPKVVKKNI